MDGPDTKNDNVGEPLVTPLSPEMTKAKTSGDIFDLNTWKNFYQLTGGSLLYCLSAVFVAYGIVKVMGPFLSGSDTLKDALLCIFTLHIYEIALLGVLILIVSRKIVDDAVSLMILIAIFLIGTSIALGSAANRNLNVCLVVGLFGVAIAFGKFYTMRRFVGIQFGTLCASGLVFLMACNYLGPVLIAKSISVKPSEDLAHRELWMFIWAAILIAGGIVLIEAMRGKYQEAKQTDRTFLKSPVMIYIFAIILLIASGVHQYSMSYMFALERAAGDYIPLVTLVSLLVIELLRYFGRRFGYIEILISCIPIVAMLGAINERTVISSWRLGFGLLSYPPVFFALSGLAIAAFAIYHKWYRLLVSVFFYGLGIILTAGFSLEHPYDLNIYPCVFTLVLSVILYGIIIRNQFVYLIGIVILCVGLLQLDSFSSFAKNLNLTEAGSVAGVFGIGSMAYYLVFGQKMHKAFQIIGAICLALSINDYLPEYIEWRCIIMLLAVGCLILLLLFIRKNILVTAILIIPFLIYLFIITKFLSYWRHVILGFLLLALGTIASLFKHLTGRKTGQDKKSETG